VIFSSGFCLTRKEVEDAFRAPLRDVQIPHHHIPGTFTATWVSLEGEAQRKTSVQYDNGGCALRVSDRP
jgi:hypothetical protein